MDVNGSVMDLINNSEQEVQVTVISQELNVEHKGEILQDVTQLQDVHSKPQVHHYVCKMKHSLVPVFNPRTYQHVQQIPHVVGIVEAVVFQDQEDKVDGVNQ